MAKEEVTETLSVNTMLIVAGVLIAALILGYSLLNQPVSPATTGDEEEEETTTPTTGGTTPTTGTNGTTTPTTTTPTIETKSEEEAGQTVTDISTEIVSLSDLLKDLDTAI